MTEATPIVELAGIGEERRKRLEKLGIATLGDLVYYFPRAYERRGDVRKLTEAELGSPCSFLLTVGTEVIVKRPRVGIALSTFRAFDESSSVEIVFFNAPYIKSIFHAGSVFRFYGKLTPGKKRFTVQLVNPKYEPFLPNVPLSDFVPIYPLTSGISSKQLAKWIRDAVNAVVPTLEDPMPEDIRLAHGLPALSYAIRNAHFPEDEVALSRAIRRLAFDEMFCFGIRVSELASKKKKVSGIRIPACSVKPYLALLPFQLTDGQRNAVQEIYNDLTKTDESGITPPMSRILVGDVGSGKTVCAALAAYMVVQNGYQAALMVPTEILARQHFEELSKQFAALGYKTALLLGSTKTKEKKEILQALADGEISLIIGTHALLSPQVVFSDLALVITDEQHRFGVEQRAVLREKSRTAHLLVMSATPIPRSLALTMYGDLDISKITGMPSGRMRVDTFVVDESYRARLNAFIRKQAAEGGQCYIVCPSIEPEETDENAWEPTGLGVGEFSSDRQAHLKSAVAFTEELQKDLPDVRIACLHGKMKAAEKDVVMTAFAAGEISVLVSTTVIEVGVNVPNATLMIVENAERFGLSQLHQLRGRVGRGKKKSYCILVSDMQTDAAKARLETMKTTYDGYEIAEKDLLLRGPGDFFATGDSRDYRQSGGLKFRFAALCNDTSLFEEAFAAAKELIATDPGLTAPEHEALRHVAEDFYSPDPNSVS